MQYYFDQPMMDNGSFGGGWSIVMMISWLLFIVIVGLVVARLLRHRTHDAHHKAEPIDIVKERYAKGDITKEEFEQFKKDLK